MKFPYETDLQESSPGFIAEIDPGRARTVPGSIDRSDANADNQKEEKLVRTELMILGINLRNRDGNDGDEKEALMRSVESGLRRILRPTPDLSVRAEGTSLGITVGNREIDLGPEIFYWFINALRSGSCTPGIFEVVLPIGWLRAAVAQLSIPVEMVSER